MSSKIRFMQASPCSMDALCSNQPLWKNCLPNTLSQYYDIDYGSHSIIICDSSAHCPSYNSYAYFPENSFNTLIASGSPNINLFVTPDGLKCSPGANKAYIRFINLAYDEPCLDFRFSDGILAIARNIAYQEITNYYPISAGNYSLEAFRCHSNMPLLSVPTISLKPDFSYTFYIPGSLNLKPNYTHLLCTDAIAPCSFCRPKPKYPLNSCSSCGKDNFYHDNFYYSDSYYY